MEGMILVAILFLTVVVLLLGILFCYFAFKLIGQEIPIGFSSNDKINEVGADTFTKSGDVPINEFVPRKDMPLKIKYSDKDQYTKEQ